MNESMDELTIEINSTVGDSVSNINKLVTSLNKLDSSLKKVVNQSKNLSILKNNLSTSGVVSSGAKKTKTFKSERSQLADLGVDLKQYKLVSSMKETNSELLKYKNNMGNVVTINRKFTDNLDGTGRELSNVKVKLSETHKELKNGNSLWNSLTKGTSGFIVKLKIIGSEIMNFAESLADMVENASKYEESLNLFKVTMGDYFGKADSFVKKFSDALYLDPANVMQYMGSFNSLIKGLGVGAENSYLMSQNLTQLVYDLASFKNYSFEESFRKLQSAISGELEPLRNTGVALSENTLQELANSLGIKQRVAEMNEAQKAQLRYIQIMKSSTEWQTDMGRTLITPANTIRVMKEQVSLLSKAIGRVFIPIIMELMPYVMALTQMLTDLANTIANFLGYEIADVDYSGLGELGTLVGDIGDEAEKTTNKLNTMLAPFDELNVVQNKTKSASDGLGALGGDLGVDLPFYDALANLDKTFGENLDKARSKLEQILNIAKDIGIVLLTWKISKGISSVLSNFGVFGEEEIFTKTIGLTLFVSGIVFQNKGAKDISENGETLASLGKVLGGTLSTFGGSYIFTKNVKFSLIITAITTWSNVLVAIKDLIDLKPSFEEITNGVIDFLDNSLAMTVITHIPILFGGNILPALGLWLVRTREEIEGYFKFLPNWFEEKFNQIVGFAEDGFDGIVDAFGGTDTWFYKIVINPISERFSGLWSNISQKASESWENIKRPFTNAGTFFYDTFSSAWSRVKEVFSTGGTIFDGIKEGIISVFTSIVNSIIRGINKVVATPFNKLNGILNAIKSVDIFGFKPFDGFWSKNPIPVPQIPEIKGYEGGGYPESGQFFMARENGIPEMVGRIGNKTAVANNEQITTAITNAVVQGLSGLTRGNTPVTVYIGNDKIYEGYGQHIDDENDRYGTNVVRV